MPPMIAMMSAKFDLFEDESDDGAATGLLCSVDDDDDDDDVVRVVLAVVNIGALTSVESSSDSVDGVVGG